MNVFGRNTFQVTTFRVPSVPVLPPPIAVFAQEVLAPLDGARVHGRSTAHGEGLGLSHRGGGRPNGGCSRAPPQGISLGDLLRNFPETLPVYKIAPQKERIRQEST